MKVKLRSNEESAAEATDRTLRALPVWPGHLERDEQGKIKFDEQGLATVFTSNPKYMAFALRNQGYVSEVFE